MTSASEAERGQRGPGNQHTKHLVHMKEVPSHPSTRQGECHSSHYTDDNSPGEVLQLLQSPAAGVMELGLAHGPVSSKAWAVYHHPEWCPWDGFVDGLSLTF